MPAEIIPFPQRKQITMKQIAMLALLVAGVMIATEYANNALGNPLQRLLPAA